MFHSGPDGFSTATLGKRVSKDGVSTIPVSQLDRVEPWCHGHEFDGPVEEMRRIAPVAILAEPLPHLHLQRPQNPLLQHRSLESAPT